MNQPSLKAAGATIAVIYAFSIIPAYSQEPTQKTEGPLFPVPEEEARTIAIDWVGGLFGVLGFGGIASAVATAACGLYHYQLNKKKEALEKINEAWGKEHERRAQENKYIGGARNYGIHRRLMPFDPGKYQTPFMPLFFDSASMAMGETAIDIEALKTESEALESRMEEAGEDENIIAHQERLNRLLFNDAIREELYRAVRTGNLDTVKRIIKDNPEFINARDSDGNTLMHYAASGKRKMLELLIRHGSATNEKNNDGYTPLVLAAVHTGATDTLDNFAVILQSIPLISNQDLSALFHMIAQQASPESHEFMAHLTSRKLHRRLTLRPVPRCEIRSLTTPISHGAGGVTILHEAVIAGNESLVCHILSHGIILVDAVDESRNTALHYAVAHDTNATNIIETLINMGANVNAQNNLRNTPLHNAIYRGNLRNLQRLMLASQKGEQILNMDLKNNQGQTALFTASSCLTSPEIISEILNDSALTNEHGQNPLHIVAQINRGDELIAILVEKGVDVNQEDADGNTPIHLAALADNSLAMRKLRIKGAELAKQNKKGETVKQIADKVEDSAAQLMMEELESNTVEQLIANDDEIEALLNPVNDAPEADFEELEDEL